MTSGLTVTWVLAFTFFGNLERQHLARTSTLAERITIGATEREVGLALGEPLAVYSAYSGWSLLSIGKHPRQWCYGTRLKLECEVDQIPVNIRLFGYESDDLVLDWTSDKKLSKIRMPEVRYPIDHRWDSLLNFCYFGSYLIRCAADGNANCSGEIVTTY